MMLSNFAFIKETSDLVFLVFASIKQNYFYKNLWLVAKRNGVCGGTLVLLCILQQKKHGKTTCHYDVFFVVKQPLACVLTVRSGEIICIDSTFLPL
jgi:hypothetical protein